MEFDKYDKNGAYHIEWFRTNKHGYRTHLNRILREFTGCKAKCILDIGCGEGLLSKLLLKKGVTKKVVGIDTSKRAISLGQGLYDNSCRTKKIELKCQSYVSINKRRKFDYIICSEVIEHVDSPEDLVRKIKNMVVKWAIVTTPNADFISPGKYDKQLFNKDTLELLLQKIGATYEFLEVGETLIVKIIK
jgi:2-polyprenyl-3-methyl-5-hydroxy-6-metoxy-1,4-benzoquinol methylase